MGSGHFFEENEQPAETEEPLTINDLKDVAENEIKKFEISTRRRRDLGSGKWKLCCSISSAAVV